MKAPVRIVYDGINMALVVDAEGELFAVQNLAAAYNDYPGTPEAVGALASAALGVVAARRDIQWMDRLPNAIDDLQRALDALREGQKAEPNMAEQLVRCAQQVRATLPTKPRG